MTMVMTATIPPRPLARRKNLRRDRSLFPPMIRFCAKPLISLRLLQPPRRLLNLIREFPVPR